MNIMHRASRYLERFRTLKDAAEILGIPTWAIRRAAKSGAIPGLSVLQFEAIRPRVRDRRAHFG